MIRQLAYNLLNLSSRLLNFLLFWIIVNRLGANLQTDWFFFVYGAVYFSVSITFYSLECALVPLWPGIPTAQQANFRSICERLGLKALPIIQLLGLVLSSYLPAKFGFSEPFDALRLSAISFMLFLHPTIAFWAALYSSFLQASGRYFFPITHLTWRAIGILCILALPGCDNILCLAAAYTVGEMVRLVLLYRAQASILSPTLSRAHARFSDFQHVFASIGWMALMTTAAALNPYVDFIMVGQFEDGGATLVEYGGRLRGMPFLALNGILVVLLGDWSRDKGQSLEWARVNKSAFLIGLIGALFSLALIVSKAYWLPAIFQTDHFDTEQSSILSHLMNWYLIGAPFMIAGNIFSRGLLVWQQFKLICYLGIGSVLVNVILNLLFIKTIGIAGVALSTMCLDVLSLGLLFLLSFSQRQIR